MSDSDIVTRCPKCNTAFRVTSNQLAVADGAVRCGSCLAVFKAVDYKTADNTASSAASSSISTQNKTPATKAEAEPQFKPQTPSKRSIAAAEKLAAMDFNDDDKSIADDDLGLELDDDIYDLDTNNKNKKTSLFDRKLQPISEHARESADESWALDMLSDLEDEEIEPIKIKRPAKKEDSPEPQALTTREKPETIKLKPRKQHQQKAQHTPPKEASTDSTETKAPAKKRGFSLFKKRSSEEATSAAAKEAESRTESEVLDFDIDHVGTTAPSMSGEREFDELAFSADEDDIALGAGPDTNTAIEGVDELHFDQDEYVDTPSSKRFSRNNKGDKSTPLHIEDEFTPISDEAIEDAMHSRTSYAGDGNYLSQIQVPPVEMEWYESERTQRWLWLLGILVLGLLLLAQVAAFRFKDLSKDPDFRPYYQSACEFLGCQLPALIDRDKIRTTNLIVRSHPSTPEALVVDAILINNARFEQAFPALRLEFSDLNNRILASRDLQPGEYLRGELAGATQMPSLQPIQLSLAIRDPGDTAVNYRLKVISATGSP